MNSYKDLTVYQKLITQEEFSNLYELCLELSRMLSSLRTKVG